MLQAWMVLRYLKSGSRFVSLTSLFAIVGMTVGVGALFVSMAVVNGFEKAIHDSVIDITGHVIVLKRGNRIENVQETMREIRQLVPDTEGFSPFVMSEGLIARKGKVLGVNLRGFSEENLKKVLPIDHRIVKGKLDFGTRAQPKALIGKVLAERFHLDIGDSFKVIIPKPTKTNSLTFQPQVLNFIVSGYLDFGKYDYNERFILTEASDIRTAVGLAKGEFSGLRLMLKDKMEAQEASRILNTSLGSGYWAKDWFQSNRNFLSALEYEKYIIFIVLSIMVIAACFNISSSLFISVLKRYGDISILKSLGADSGFIVRLFSVQGVIVGVFGTLSGTFFGILLCILVKYTSWFKLPAEVYKLERLPVDMRIGDFLLIVFTALLLSFLSTLLPAYRGSQLSPVEGLKYE